MTEKRSPLVGSFNINILYTKTENSYPFLRANQQKANIKSIHEISMTSMFIDVIGVFWGAIVRDCRPTGMS